MPSSCTSQGIKIDISTVYLDEYSKPAKKNYLFCYRITITNESDKWVKLLNRHWIIIDSESHKEEIKGPGVVGQQPELEPGESHQYFSFCNLATEFGTMEGSYEFTDKTGENFLADIPRFYLSSNLSEFEKNKFSRGQIVHHKLYDYRGVIADFDMYFLNDEKWYEANESKPPKDMPWYYVLADDTNTVHYVAQENLENCDDNSEIEHPLMQIFFNGFENERYIRNDKTWQDLDD